MNNLPLYRDIDGAMRPASELSQQGFIDNCSVSLANAKPAPRADPRPDMTLTEALADVAEIINEQSAGCVWSETEAARVGGHASLLLRERGVTAKVTVRLTESEQEGYGFVIDVADPVPVALIETWQPGDESLGPRACPACGSIGTGRFMPDHIAAEHPRDAGRDREERR